MPIFSPAPATRRAASSGDAGQFIGNLSRPQNTQNTGKSAPFEIIHRPRSPVAPVQIQSWHDLCSSIPA